MKSSSIAILTDIPSPYQVELLEALACVMSQPVRAIFLRETDPDRKWRLRGPDIEHCFLVRDGFGRAARWIRDSELVVFGSYASIPAQRLIWLRMSVGGPWAFWGERPGANLRNNLGRWLRRIVQTPIRIGRVPVWGIGAWAVEGYRVELGDDRLLLNVPYFSDLSRFFAIDRPDPRQGREIRFLYSGSLIERKGVDVLARAFRRVVANGTRARLTFLGAGPLEAQIRAETADVAQFVDLVGFKQWRELAAIYAAHDILCAPSRYDGWGLVVPEGLAAGMPVLAGREMGAARELLSPDIGWRVDADDESAIEAALRAAAALSPSERADMSRRARERARDLHVTAGVARMQDAIAATKAAWERPGSGSPHAGP